jgi:flagellar hook-associated protein 1 FlgK
MTLTTALRTASSSLASHSQQISNISRNISGVGDPTYVRRDSDVYTALNGTTRIETQRYVNQSVLASTLSANSNAARTQSLANGIDRVASLQQLESFAFSPSNLLAGLQQSVEFAAAAPSDSAALGLLVEKTKTVSNAINISYDEILSMRQQADKEIASSVENINSLLARIKDVNDVIVDGTRVGRDVFDNLDSRDRLINELSEEIGINLISAENNDLIITTSSGALLFEGKPREVSFQSTPAYGPQTSGSQLRVDGVTVSGPDTALPIRSGRIAGTFELRDNFLVQQQNQLDEVARGLVELFAEQDQTGGGKPNLVGLFTWHGGPAVPTAASLEPGIAANLRINPLIDPVLGGDPAYLRDGGIHNDPDYIYNSNGGAGYSDRLYALSQAFDVPITFDPVAGLHTDQSLTGFAFSSLDQLNGQRASALDQSEYQVELALQFRQTLQGETGVNLDYELSRMLEVERAYQASARLLNTVDDMLSTLLDSVR